MLQLAHYILEFSMLGCVEVASVAFILYYIYAKTRAPAVIANIFPNLNFGTHYRSSLVKFNKMGNKLKITLRSGTNSEEKIALAHGLGTQNMLEMMPHAKNPLLSPMNYGNFFPILAQTFRFKKYNFPKVAPCVVQDPVLQLAIKQAAEQQLREQRIIKTTAARNDEQKNSSEDSDGDVNDKNDDNDNYQRVLHNQQTRARTILKNMSSTLNNWLLGLTTWLLYKLLPCFLSGVVTHTQQIEMLRAAAERSPGVPLIFVPLHRSHLDYILVTFILANNDIRSPLVAAGNNLQIPVFGGLLRGLGAFFIKRKIDPVVGKKDILYRAILHLYLQHALKLGHNVEFFIEGGRTRTGKPCMPKGGILSVIVNAFMDRSIQDALLVPVSLNYERLVDGNFVSEQKGENKKPETFGKAVSGIWKALNSDYGLMRIDFNEPYSIRELVQSYNQISKDEGSPRIYKPHERVLKHNQSTSSLYGTDVINEEHRTLIDSISREVVFDCAVATSVMSTNALAFLFLTRFRQGALDIELAKALDELRSMLQGRKDMAFAGKSVHIINYACDMLGPDLVVRSKTEHGLVTLKPVQTVDSFIELAYYSNVLTPHFALQSIVLTTFHSLLPSKTANDENDSNKNEDDQLGVSRRKLISAALDNCQIYRYEFILHKPTQVLETMVNDALDELILKEYIKLPKEKEIQEDLFMNREVSKNVAAYFNDDDEYDDMYYGEEPEDSLDSDQFEQTPDLFYTLDTADEQKILCEVLAPFAHSYQAVAQSLSILYKNSMLESHFIQFVINDLTSKVQNGSCPYAESISTDSVRNCLKVLEKWSVVEICNERGLRLLTLGTLFETSQDALKRIVGKVLAIVPNYRYLQH